MKSYVSASWRDLSSLQFLPARWKIEATPHILGAKDLVYAFKNVLLLRQHAAFDSERTLLLLKYVFP